MSNESKKILNRDEVQRQLEESLRQGFSDMERASDRQDGQQTSKLLGIELPLPAVALFTSLWNEGSHRFTRMMTSRTYDIIEALGTKIDPKFAGSMGLKRTATVGTFAINAGIKSSPYIKPFFDDLGKQAAARKDIVRKLAPVLDDIKGNHSVGAFMGIQAKDNEMIYAHRRRMGMVSQVANLNNFINLTVNAGFNIAGELPALGKMWKGTHPDDLWMEESEVVEQAEPEKQPSRKENRRKRDFDELKDFGRMAVTTGAGPISTVIINSNNRQLQKKLSPYSALEMVLTLEEQLSQNPEARSFQMPGKHAESYPLEEYLAQIVIQHQKDMSDISSEHTQIREALHENLAAAVMPIADALRKGDISAFSLIRLIGEGKIVRKRGRRIADPETVKVLVGETASKKPLSVAVDPKEYYADAAFTKDELKASLHALQGEEKQQFAAYFPDSVLKEAGMSDKDIASLREHTAQQYEQHLAAAVTALAAENEESLKSQGLSEKEIRRVQEAAQLIAQDKDAIKQLKMSPVNARGIELTLANAAIPKVKGGEVGYLGKLIQSGKSLLANKAETSANDNLHSANDNDDVAQDEFSDAKAVRTAHRQHAARERDRRLSQGDEAQELGA